MTLSEDLNDQACESGSFESNESLKNLLYFDKKTFYSYMIFLWATYLLKR